MWLEGYPFEMSGTLHMSAREAWEQFGYRMKEGVVGITFVRHRNRVFAEYRGSSNKDASSASEVRKKEGVIPSLFTTPERRL